jgi:hypothetical protein
MKLARPPREIFEILQHRELLLLPWYTTLHVYILIT